MSAQDRILRNSFFSILQVIISSASYVGIYLYVIFTLGREQLGIWSLITSVPAVLSFLGSGVSGSLLRYIPIYVARQQPQEVGRLIINGILFNFIVALLLIIPGFIFSKSILQFIFGIEMIQNIYFKLYCLALVAFTINFTTSAILSGLEGLQLIQLKNRILIWCSLAFCIVAFIFIYLFGILGLLYAQVLQAVLVLFMSFKALKNSIGFTIDVKNADLKTIRIFYTYGSNLQYISILSMLFDPVTRFFLNRYFGLSIVGSYDIVNRIITQLKLLIVSSVQVIVPFVSNKTESGGFEIDMLYAKALRGVSLTASILFGLLTTLAFSFVNLFEKMNISEFQIIYMYLAIAYMVNILSSPAYFILLGMGELKHLTISHALSTCLNFLLFAMLAWFPLLTLMVLPTFLAILISSLYLWLKFNTHYLAKPVIKTSFSDLVIHGVNLLFPLVCMLISFYYFSLTLLILTATLHSVTLLYLILKHDYIREIIGTILRRVKPKQSYG